MPGAWLSPEEDWTLKGIVVCYSFFAIELERATFLLTSDMINIVTC